MSKWLLYGTLFTYPCVLYIGDKVEVMLSPLTITLSDPHDEVVLEALTDCIWSSVRDWRELTEDHSNKPVVRFLLVILDSSQ